MSICQNVLLIHEYLSGCDMSITPVYVVHVKIHPSNLILLKNV